MFPEMPSESPTSPPNGHAVDPAATDALLSTYRRRLQRLVEVETECLNDPESDRRCLGPIVAKLKTVLALYEQAVLDACTDPKVILKLRQELQTYVALLRTIERFENLDLRRAELQPKQQRDRSKIPNTYRPQFRP